MIDTGKFIANFPKALSPKGIRQPQIIGFNQFINYWNFHPNCTDIRLLAYVIATAWHEVATTMQPIEEWGKGNGRAYGKPDQKTGKTYYGRGFCQLTWKENYKKFSKITGVDLVTHPEMALDMAVAVAVIFEGSIHGMFTGKKLSDYFNDKKNDPIGARWVINSQDQAIKIAGYYALFLDLIKNSKQDLA